MTKVQTPPGKEPMNYDYRIRQVDNHDKYGNLWASEVFKDGDWSIVSVFFSEKEAKDWLKGGVSSARVR